MNSMMKSDARGWSCTVGSDADGLKILRGGQTMCESFWRHVNRELTIKQFEGSKRGFNGESILKGISPLPRMSGSTGCSAIITAGSTPKLFCPSLRQHNYPVRH